MKESFLIYKSFYEPIKDMNDEQLGRLLRALFEYHINGTEIVDKDIQIPFKFFLNQFKLDEVKWLQRVEVAKLNGKKGGRPAKNQVGSHKTNSVNSKPKKPDNVNDKENENGNDNVNETEIVLPFLSDEFRRIWIDWKNYRRVEHGFKYKSKISEQTALNKLQELSQGRERLATEILNQSVENGWKGFFQLQKKKESKPDSDYLQELQNRLS